MEGGCKKRMQLIFCVSCIFMHKIVMALCVCDMMRAPLWGQDSAVSREENSCLEEWQISQDGRCGIWIQIVACLSRFIPSKGCPR